MNKNDQEIKQARKMRNQLFDMTKNLIDKWEFYLNIQDDALSYSSFNTKQIDKNNNKKKIQVYDGRFNESKSNNELKKNPFQQFELRQDLSQKLHLLNTPESKPVFEHSEQSFNRNNYIIKINNCASMTDIKQKPLNNKSKYTNSTKQFLSERFILSKPQLQIKQEQFQDKIELNCKELKPNKLNYEYIYAKQQAQYLRDKFRSHLTRFHTKQEIQEQELKLKIFLQQRSQD